MNNFLKSQQEIDEYIKNISIQEDTYSIENTKQLFFYGEQKGELSTIEGLHMGNSALQDSFFIIKEIYNAYDPKQQLYSFSVSSLQAPNISWLQDYLNQGKASETAFNCLLEQEGKQSITSYYSELDKQDFILCNRYYSYEWIIKCYETFIAMGLKVEGVVINLENENKPDVIFLLQITETNFLKVSKDLLEEYKSYITYPFTNKTYTKAKEEVLLHIENNNGEQGKEGKGILIDNFGEVGYEVYKYVLFILMFEKSIIIKKYSDFIKTFEIDLIKEVDDMYLLETEDGELHFSEKLKGFRKLNEFINDKNCKTIILEKDNTGSIKYIKGEKHIDASSIKYVDIQKQYKHSEIQGKVHNGKTKVYNVTEKVKLK